MHGEPAYDMGPLHHSGSATPKSELKRTLLPHTFREPSPHLPAPSGIAAGYISGSTPRPLEGKHTRTSTLSLSALLPPARENRYAAREKAKGTVVCLHLRSGAGDRHGGAQAAPRRVRAGRRPAREEADGALRVLLHGDQGGHGDEAGAECVPGAGASPAPSGAGGDPGGAGAQPAVHREAFAGDAAAVGAAAGVEAGVPVPAGAAGLHRQQDRGRERRAAPGDPRGRGHRLALRPAPAVPARRAGAALRGLRLRRPRRVDRRRVRPERRQGARREAPAPHRRRRPRHAGRPRRRQRPPVHRQLLLGPLPQVPHRGARGAGRLRGRQGRRGHDRGLQRPRPPRRTVPEALPSGARRRRVAAGEDRQGRGLPPEAAAARRGDRAGVPPDAHREAGRAARHNGRRHDGPHVGRDHDPRQDMPRRRQGVRVCRARRHRLRQLHQPAGQARVRRRRARDAAAEQGPEGVRASAVPGGVRAAAEPPGGRARHHAHPCQQQHQQPPNAAERSAGRAAASFGDPDLVPGHPGAGLPDRRRPLRPEWQLQLPDVLT